MASIATSQAGPPTAADGYAWDERIVLEGGAPPWVGAFVVRASAQALPGASITSGQLEGYATLTVSLVLPDAPISAQEQVVGRVTIGDTTLSGETLVQAHPDVGGALLVVSGPAFTECAPDADCELDATVELACPGCEHPVVAETGELAVGITYADRGDGGSPPSGASVRVTRR